MITNTCSCQRRLAYFTSLRFYGHLRVDMDELQQRARQNQVLPIDGLLLVAYLEHDYPTIAEISANHAYAYNRIRRIAETVADTIGAGFFDGKKAVANKQLMDSFMLENLWRTVL